MLSIVVVTGLAASATVAAAEVKLYIDGQEVRTEQYDWTDDNHREKTPDIFYMDAKPQIVSGRAFVPIRVLSAYFNARVDWESPHAYVILGDTTLTLTIGSNTVTKNGIEMTLEAAPYVEDGRTMVPLRFIAEAFGCDVDNINGDVYISTPPLYINNKRVASTQFYVKMTVGGILSESKTNICANQLYQYLTGSMGDEIEMFDYFGDGFFTERSTKLLHYIFREVSFLETEGLDGTALRQFRIFANHDSDEWTNYFYDGSDYMSVSSVGLGKYLIYDITHNLWYKVPENNTFSACLNMRYLIGEWKVLENSTP